MSKQMGIEVSVFHAGETAIHKKLGLRDHRTVRMAEVLIRDHMPDQHREFFSQLAYAFIGLADKEGRPWPTIVSGSSGFISTPHDKCLVIDSPFLLEKELGLEVFSGQKIGCLGLDLSNRRRNRLNGVITSIDGQITTIDVEQSFGNCPKYIQRHALKTQVVGDCDIDVKTAGQLSAKDKAHIKKSGIFFIASRSGSINSDPRSGIDVSHRGGRSGFVRVDDEGVLSFPDFSGNNFFNTLGNIQSDSRVGLLFPNFETGHAICIAGNANIIWDGPSVTAYEGVERIIDIQIERVFSAPNALPVTGGFIDAWPGLEKTAIWADGTTFET